MVTGAVEVEMAVDKEAAVVVGEGKVKVAARGCAKPSRNGPL